MLMNVMQVRQVVMNSVAAVSAEFFSLLISKQFLTLTGHVCAITIKNAINVYSNSEDTDKRLLYYRTIKVSEGTKFLNSCTETHL